jgi:hypothetical protein
MINYFKYLTMQEVFHKKFPNRSNSQFFKKNSFFPIMNNYHNLIENYFLFYYDWFPHICCIHLKSLTLYPSTKLETINLKYKFLDWNQSNKILNLEEFLQRIKWNDAEIISKCSNCKNINEIIIGNQIKKYYCDLILYPKEVYSKKICMYYEAN